MKRCQCGKHWISRGKYCVVCRLAARRVRSLEYYWKRGRWLRVKRKKRNAVL